MSHFWHKPLTFIAGAAAVASMVGVGAFNAGGSSPQTAHASSTNVTFSFDQFPDGLNIDQASATVDIVAGYLVGSNGPTTVAARNNGSPEYDAITKPVFTNHGKTISFSLHKGMKWSNGDAMTTQDYLLAWKAKMALGLCAGSCDNVKSISLHGKYGITLHMKTIYAAAVWGAVGNIPLYDHKWDLNGMGGVTKGDVTACLHANASNNFKACTKYATELFTDSALNYTNDSFVVAGPYEVDTFSNNNEITYKPDPNYTSSMPGGKPHYQHLTFLFYPSVAAMIAGAARKDTDVTDDYVLNDVGTPHQAGSLKSYSKIFKTYVSGPIPEALHFNERNKFVDVEGQNAASHQPNPFYGSKGLKVRQALLLGFNRAKLIVASFAPLSLGVANKLVSWCFPLTCAKSGGSPFHAKNITGNWDPIHSKWVPGTCATSKKNGGDGRNNTATRDALKLLKQAGYGPKNHLHVYLSSTTASWRVLEEGYLQQCWQALGSWVTVTPENVKSTHYFDSYANGGTINTGKYEADIHAYSASNPDPSGWLGNLRGDKCPQDPPHTAAQGNTACIADHLVDKALNKGQATFNTAARQHWYTLLDDEIAKKADIASIAPRPQIWTWDGVPKSGFAMSAWTNGPTWSVFRWKQ